MSAQPYRDLIPRSSFPELSCKRVFAEVMKAKNPGLGRLPWRVLGVIMSVLIGWQKTSRCGKKAMATGWSSAFGIVRGSKPRTGSH